MAQWWGPHHFTNPVCEIDVRPGGKWLIHMKAPDGTVYPMTGTFTEVVKPERLVFTAFAEALDGTKYLECDTDVTFEEQGGRTRLTVKANAKGLHPTRAADARRHGRGLVAEPGDGSKRSSGRWRSRRAQPRRTISSQTGEGRASNGTFHAAQLPASTTWTGSMISAGIASPRRCRTAASVAISLIAMALKSAVASIRPAAMAATASGMALTPTSSGPVPRVRIERIQHAERHDVVGAQHSVDARPLLPGAEKYLTRDVALVIAAQRASHVDGRDARPARPGIPEAVRGWWRRRACLRA